MENDLENLFAIHVSKLIIANLIHIDSHIRLDIYFDLRCHTFYTVLHKTTRYIRVKLCVVQLACICFTYDVSVEDADTKNSSAHKAAGYSI